MERELLVRFRRKKKPGWPREAGADEVILYTQSDFETETKRLTDGKGVNVVYDSVGKTTFDKGLNILKSRGMMVLFRRIQRRRATF